MELDAYLARLGGCEAEALRAEVQRLEKAVEQGDGEVHALVEALGRAKTELERIDGGSRAAELGAEIEAERAALRDYAERYAVYTLAEVALREAVERFEREHQPGLLEAASRFFAAMTAGRYRRVQRRLDGTLQVEREGGGTLLPDKLSTGTREQLFLAIRLAYIEHYRRSAEPLPIVLDDVLVNFDRGRARATLGALGEVAGHTQVLLFTCHEHFAELAAEAAPAARRVRLPTAG
jgi:uncharacterized protein YhaN